MFLSAAWVCLAATPAFAQNDNNGFPPGGHYTLNIQGKTNCAGGDLTGSNRHTIQVLLNVQSNQDDLVDRKTRSTWSLGSPGSQPQVLDGNACDRGGACSVADRRVQFLGATRGHSQAKHQHEHHVVRRR